MLLVWQLNIYATATRHLLFLCKLLRLIVLCKYASFGFRNSYIVPVPKIKDSRSKKITCEDFGGIAISSVIYKVFEYCILDKYKKKYFTSSNKQFGFKTDYGCRNTNFTIRKVDERLNKGKYLCHCQSF